MSEGHLCFRQTRTGLPMRVRYSNEIAEWKWPPIFKTRGCVWDTRFSLLDWSALLAWCRRRGIGVRAYVFSRATGATAHFVNRKDGVKTFKLGP